MISHLLQHKGLGQGMSQIFGWNRVCKTLVLWNNNKKIYSIELLLDSFHLQMITITRLLRWRRTARIHCRQHAGTWCMACDGRLLQCPFYPKAKPGGRGPGLKHGSWSWPKLLLALQGHQKQLCLAPDEELPPALQSGRAVSCLPPGLVLPFGLHLDLCQGTIRCWVIHIVLEGQGCVPWAEDFPRVWVWWWAVKKGCRRREHRTAKCCCFWVSGNFSGCQRVKQGGDW